MDKSESHYENARILVVDDILASRRVIQRLLSKLGFQNIELAESGAQALEKLIAGDFELIISDLHLNDMTGVDLLRDLSKKTPQKTIPFILITSDANQREYDTARRAGVKHFLLKPLNTASLEEKISELFGGVE